MGERTAGKEMTAVGIRLGLVLPTLCIQDTLFE